MEIEDRSLLKFVFFVFRCIKATSDNSGQQQRVNGIQQQKQEREAMIAIEDERRAII